MNNSVEIQKVDPVFITVKQMAEFLGISTWVAYQILNDGAVDSRYIGRSRKVVIESLRQYARNLPTEPAEAS